MAKPNPTASELKHADGTVVTAQEAYDAFMNTRVLIVHGGNAYEIISIVWYDNNSAQADPTNVGYVKLSYVVDVSGTVHIGITNVGDASLVPTQQG